MCCRFLRALSAASFGWVSVHCALVWHVSVFDVKPALILCWNLMIVTIQWKNNSSGNDNWINQIFRSSLWQFKTQQIRWKINLFETNVGCARVCVSVHSCSLDDKSSSIAWKKKHPFSFRYIRCDIRSDVYLWAIVLYFQRYDRVFTLITSLLYRNVKKLCLLLLERCVTTEKTKAHSASFAAYEYIASQWSDFDIW